jgi:hypothetical protein
VNEGLSYLDTERLLLRLGDASERLVVVGGQAVNFWATSFLERAADLTAEAPFTSRDVDVCAPRSQVEDLARRLGGQARVAGFDDATPNAGTIVYRDDHGTERILDVMSTLMGLDPSDVEKTSIPIEYATTNGALVRFRVMHPVVMMESRVHNVVRLERYRTAHGLSQARASVLCAREYLREMLGQSPPEVVVPRVRDWDERIFRFRTKAQAGKQIALDYGINVFDAVVVDPRMGEKFLTVRHPQMVAHVESLPVAPRWRPAGEEDSRTLESPRRP